MASSEPLSAVTPQDPAEPSTETKPDGPSKLRTLWVALAARAHEWGEHGRCLLGSVAIAGLALVVGSLLPDRQVNITLDFRAAAATIVFVTATLAVRQSPGADERLPCASYARSATGVAARASFARGRTSSNVSAPGMSKGSMQLDLDKTADAPDSILRDLVAWRAPGGVATSEAEVQEIMLRHECPACSDVLLAPRKLSCQHHVCSSCLDKLVDSGAGTCPRCNAAVDFAAATEPSPELMTSLSTRQCGCSACGRFEGTFEQLRSHVLGCAPARGVLLMRLCTYATEAERRRVQPATIAAATIEALRVEMTGASPVLVHRIPPHALESTNSYWSSPPFSVRNRCFSLRMGPLGSGGMAPPGGSAGKAKGPRYFCLLPHGHDERLRCSIFFAKRPGEGFKERRVHDWPKELAGHPWGPTVRAEEVEELRQADGSLLLMIHAAGLGAEGEDDVAVNGGTGDN